MFRLIVLFSVLLAAYGATVPRRSRTVFPVGIGKIVGGSVVGIDKVPWQVAVEDTGFLICGGSIISANYVLTAAHCTSETSAKFLKVRSGTTKLEDGGTVSDVASFVQHPKYTLLDYDITVLKLAKPLSLSSNQQAIPLRNAEALKGETAQVSGWGTVSEDEEVYSSDLRAVDVPIVSRADCKKDYSDPIVTDRMICAGSVGKDSCSGDSGGAITIDNAQVGIGGWGYGCAEENYPGVYTNIAALKDFILENTNNETKWV